MMQEAVCAVEGLADGRIVDGLADGHTDGQETEETVRRAIGLADGWRTAEADGRIDGHADGRAVARADVRRDGRLRPACGRVGGRPRGKNSCPPSGRLCRRLGGWPVDSEADGQADFHQSERPSATLRVQNSPIRWTVELLSRGKVDEVLMSHDVTIFGRTSDVLTTLPVKEST